MPAPSVEQYKRAFRIIYPRLHHNYLAMLKAHYFAPERTITMSELANAVGYSGYQPANLHYGKLGRMLAEELSYKKERLRGQSGFIDVLATENPAWDRKEDWQWIMRPEVATALEELGWV